MEHSPAPEEAIRLLARIAEMHSNEAPDSLVLWCDNAQHPETVLTLGHVRAIAALTQHEPVGRIDAIERAICQERCAQMGEPACWSVAGKWSNPDCRDPDCRSLACAAIAAWNRRAGGEREQRLEEALRDMLAGWRYIRTHHGDLYGVGWDRCEEAARAALAGQTEGERNGG